MASEQSRNLRKRRRRVLKFLPKRGFLIVIHTFRGWTFIDIIIENTEAFALIAVINIQKILLIIMDNYSCNEANLKKISRLKCVLAR